MSPTAVFIQDLPTLILSLGVKEAWAVAAAEPLSKAPGTAPLLVAMVAMVV
jgi:hypothetical protein